MRKKQEIEKTRGRCYVDQRNTFRFLTTLSSSRFSFSGELICPGLSLPPPVLLSVVGLQQPEVFFPLQDCRSSELRQPGGARLFYAAVVSRDSTLLSEEGSLQPFGVVFVGDERGISSACRWPLFIGQRRGRFLQGFGARLF
jgi:hypothetical protein